MPRTTFDSSQPKLESCSVCKGFLPLHHVSCGSFKCPNAAFPQQDNRATFDAGANKCQAIQGADSSRSARVKLLEEATAITSADRNKAYGNPEDNFQNIANSWNAYLTAQGKADTLLSSQDVAYMMILMKVARLATNPDHRDSILDVAGYAACAESCRVNKEQQRGNQNASAQDQ